MSTLRASGEGSGMWIRFSNRRTSASSISHGKLVAASTMTCLSKKAPECERWGNKLMQWSQQPMTPVKTSKKIMTRTTKLHLTPAMPPHHPSASRSRTWHDEMLRDLDHLHKNHHVSNKTNPCTWYQKQHSHATNKDYRVVHTYCQSRRWRWQRVHKIWPSRTEYAPAVQSSV